MNTSDLENRDLIDLGGGTLQANGSRTLSNYDSDSEIKGHGAIQGYAVSVGAGKLTVSAVN